MASRSELMQLDPDSLERLVPDTLRAGDDTGDQTLRLHLERYEFAARQASGTRVLDIACGVGYGTRYLCERLPAALVTGVDLSAAAIEYAVGRYANDRTRFVVADAFGFADPDGFDTIVSLETIEHLPEPARFIAHLVGLLRPGGILVGSAPTTPSVDANPHHLHDFTEPRFRALFLAHGLREQAALRQVHPYSPLALLRRREPRMGGVRRNLPAYYAAHPGALLRRVASTLRYGFSNRYITIAWRREG